MTSQHFSGISDRELIDAVQRAATKERDATVELLGLLGEFDARKLYLGEGCASLTLTTAVLLRPTLRAENADAVLEAAAFKSKREVEVLVAGLAPKPDVRTMLRRLPGVTAPPLRFEVARAAAPPPSDADTSREPAAAVAAPVIDNSPNGSLPDVAKPRAFQPRAMSTPLSPDRFLLRLTISGDTHAKLRRAQDLLRPSIPSGDAAAVISRALTMLVEHLERAKAGHARRLRPVNARPAKSDRPTTRSRHGRLIPNAVRRAVWQRDEGRCTFAGPHGRCTETAWLELHHIIAFARGGPTEAANLTLRCRAHNQFDAEREFGPRPRRPCEISVGLPL